MNKKEEIIEVLIMAGLFRATVEQGNHFNERFKYKEKQDFKRWREQGYRMLTRMGVDDNEPITRAITEGIEDVVHEFRKQMERDLGD